MASTQEMRNSIYKMGNDELNEIARAVKSRRQELAGRALDGLQVGDTVQFDAGRKGGIRTGTVQKVNRKNVKVSDNDAYMMWNVAGTLLERVDG